MLVLQVIILVILDGSLLKEGINHRSVFQNHNLRKMKLLAFSEGARTDHIRPPNHGGDGVLLLMMVYVANL